MKRSSVMTIFINKQAIDIEITTLAKRIPKLITQDAEKLEGEINLAEATNALRNMNNGKSPGTDGFPAEVLKFFQKTERGNFEVRAINEGFHKGEMFPSHKEGIITCIPKGDKPREHLKILHI